MRKRRITEYRCHRCNWKWIPRKSEIPAVCPHCHSTRWWDAKTDEQVAAQWLTFYVEQHAFDLLKVVESVGDGIEVDTRFRRRAKALVRLIDTKADRRTKRETGK